MMILQVLLWMLVALVALVLLLMSLPIHLRLRIVADTDVSTLLEIRVLSGSLPALWSGDPTGATARYARRGKKAARHRTTPKARQKLSARRRRWAIAGIRALPEILAGTIRGVHLDRILLHCRFGLDDPAETGSLFGRICPVLYGVPIPNADLRVVPDFDGETLSGQADVALHAIPARLAWPAIRAAGEILLGVRR